MLAAELTREAPGSDVIELAHPILLSVWPELGRWPEDERRFESWHSELLAAVSREGSSLSGLSSVGSVGSVPLSQPALHLSGYRLAEAERWLADRPAQIDKRVLRFVKASVQAQSRRTTPQQTTPPPRRRFVPWVIAVTQASMAVPRNSANQAAS